MATATVEDYVKQLYIEQQSLREPRGMVSPGRLARAMGVVPGTATTMLRTLADAKLIRYEPRGGARLTPAGVKLALHVLRRHRLVELFLVSVLNFDWADVHDEAERLEHVVSDALLERIDLLLGRPQVDPHGDPIPDAQGRMVRRSGTRSLGDVEAGKSFRVVRVLSQDVAFLRFAKKGGLVPEASGTVVTLDPTAGTIGVRVGSSKAPLTLSLVVAAMIEVAPVAR